MTGNTTIDNKFKGATKIFHDAANRAIYLSLESRVGQAISDFFLKSGAALVIEDQFVENVSDGTMPEWAQHAKYLPIIMLGGRYLARKAGVEENLIDLFEGGSAVGAIGAGILLGDEFRTLYNLLPIEQKLPMTGISSWPFFLYASTAIKSSFPERIADYLHRSGQKIKETFINKVGDVVLLGATAGYSYLAGGPEWVTYGAAGLLAAELVFDMVVSRRSTANRVFNLAEAYGGSILAFGGLGAVLLSFVSPDVNPTDMSYYALLGMVALASSDVEGEDPVRKRGGSRRQSGGGGRGQSSPSGRQHTGPSLSDRFSGLGAGFGGLKGRFHFPKRGQGRSASAVIDEEYEGGIGGQGYAGRSAPTYEPVDANPRASAGLGMGPAGNTLYERVIGDVENYIGSLPDDEDPDTLLVLNRILPVEMELRTQFNNYVLMQVGLLDPKDASARAIALGYLMNHSSEILTYQRTRTSA